MPEQKKISRLALLWQLSRGGRLLYLGSIIAMAIAIVASYLVPQIIRFAVDSVVGDVPMSQPMFVQNWVERLGGVDYLRDHMLILGVAALVVASIGGVMNFLRGRFVAMSCEGAIKRFRDKLYAHIQMLPYSWHVKIQTGDIIQRCTSDVDVVRNFIQNQLPEMVRTILLVSIAYTILFSMNVPMSLASLVFLPVMFAYSFVFVFKISSRFLRADEAEGQLLSVAQENLTGVRVVRAFGRERFEVDRFQKENHHFADLWVKLGNLLGYYWSSSDMVTSLQMLTICVVGVYQAIEGRLTVGEFLVFLSYNSMTIWPVRGLGRILSEASKTSVSMGRLREILDTPEEADAPDATEAPVSGDIVYDNVSFSYDSIPVLENVSLTIKKGTTLGILGGTGSGKTTLAHLLCRLYDLEPDGGSISIGGTDITKIKRRWLRKNIGIVLQEPFLYSRTIKENISSLSSLHSLDEVRRAAEISCVDDSIDGFAKGYDTIVGERGVTLSGGQKQRVAIARAIINDPPIMIFDDSLSAVDTETDTRIRQALQERTNGTTTIIIAHRITSISKADKIMVLDKGKVLEVGTHDELLAQNGVYRRVYDLQSSVDDVEEEVAE